MNGISSEPGTRATVTSLSLTLGDVPTTIVATWTTSAPTQRTITGSFGDALVGKALALESVEFICIDFVQAPPSERRLNLQKFIDLGNEPAIDPAQRVNVVDGEAQSQRIGKVTQAIRPGRLEFPSQ